MLHSSHSTCRTKHPGLLLWRNLNTLCHQQVFKNFLAVRRELGWGFWDGLGTHYYFSQFFAIRIVYSNELELENKP